jgi:hypothetical protein
VSRALGSAALALVVALLAACTSKQRDETSTDPESTVAAPVPARSVASPRPWYQGTWQGKYDAKRHQLDVAPDAGRIRAWDDDDGTRGTGTGVLEIAIDADGRVTGSSKGALGDLSASGAVEGESVRLRLLPRPGAPGLAFAGYMVAERNSEVLTGVLRASSGDSLLVRRAEVELEKHRD